MFLVHVNVLLGYQSGFNNNDGNDNMFLGYRAGYINSGGDKNIFLGYYAGYNNTSGNDNIFLGYYAGNDNTTGSNNIFIGYKAGELNTTGDSSMYIGYLSGAKNISGDANTFLGYEAGANSTMGGNTYIGAFAGNSSTSGFMNTLVGTYAGMNLTNGSQNTIVGWKAGGNNTGGTGNVFLGYNAGLNETGSRTLYIDNTATSDPIIYGELTTYPWVRFLKFNATVGVNWNKTGSYNVYGMWVDGGTSSLYSMYVYKGAVSNGSWAKSSDKRWKKDIQPLSNVLERVMQVDGVSYRFRTDEFPDKKFSDKEQIGMIAQDLEKQFPELVLTDEQGFKAIDYGVLSAVLWQAVKEQQKEINELKNKIISNETLKTRIERLEKIISEQ
jgi:hypothetical protein